MNPYSRVLKFVPKKLKSKKAILGIILIFAVLVILTRGGAKKDQIKTAEVVKKDISSQVSASGEIKSETSANLYFGTGGKITWLNIKKGDHVEPGQALAYLDASQFSAALRQAQQDVNAADAILSQVYDEQKKQTQAENFDQKIRRTNAETAKNKAFDAVKIAQNNLDNSVITAPASGTITQVDAIVGQEVLATTAIAKIADLENISFVSEVDETEVGKISTGQETTVILDAFPNDPIESKVESIAPSAITTSTGATAYETKIVLPQDSKYKIGLNGEAQIATDKTQDTLVVPIESLIDDKYVYVQNGSVFKKTEVQKGISSDTEIEITSPLKSGDKVVTVGFDQIGKMSLLDKIVNLFNKS